MARPARPRIRTSSTTTDRDGLLLEPGAGLGDRALVGERAPGVLDRAVTRSQFLAHLVDQGREERFVGRIAVQSRGAVLRFRHAVEARGPFVLATRCRESGADLDRREAQAG